MELISRKYKDKDKIWGGLSVITAGDTRQCSVVVPNSNSKIDIYQNSIISSYLLSPTSNIDDISF